MENRKRKEVSGLEGQDVAEMSDRRTKSRELDVKEDDTVQIKTEAPIIPEAVSTEQNNEPSPAMEGGVDANRVVASALDATALPNGTTESASIMNGPVIDTENPPVAPINIPTLENLDVDTKNELPTAPAKVPPKQCSPEKLAYWNQMFFDLMLYRIGNGNVNVKSTDTRHANLYKWIVQLRKDYKTRERDPSESTLTEEQIRVLESVRFAFTTRGEEHWQKNYEKLKEYKADHGHVLVPRQCEIPGLGDWVTSQRQQYQEYTKGKPTPLTKQRKELLDEIGFQFRIRNRPEWSSKYEELLTYKEKNGDTRVPQHYKANKALGKWVAKQREQYKLHKKGKHSFLTPDRLEKLNSIGFVWSVRGESSTEKNTTTVLSDNKGESNTISVVDAIMEKAPSTVQEGEAKVQVLEEKKNEENAAAVAAAVTTLDVDPVIV
eukprot:CAMPEP_0201219670 /NCGR_PEP_ID=MMETSP0851-20130426/191195_1 /ASSEMBLY_ACC=CAM_ASM_000631 /TAXON_ID=183588 /ORGANISM="Pseudo-nitzschia fraudulenta, Strain WWA7" /LENGTH=434 /DNA_ID=CAMNT_0047509361 /DNA_START=30 /DNA_END=1334 /DNA_ORIENTATION=+